MHPNLKAMSVIRSLLQSLLTTSNRAKLTAPARVSLALGVALAVACGVPTSKVVAQTTIYDGSQQLNFYSASHLDDVLMLNNNPGDSTRNGIVQSGADPNVLEQGDAAWFRSTGRRMRNTNLGAAASATGVDGDFMSSLFDSSGATTSGGDINGVGAGYVLYDAGATTGLQTFNISLYYNDPTPNATDPENPGDINDGGNVAIRVHGVHAFDNNSDPTNPWDDDRFTFLAGSGASGGWIAAGNPRAEAGDPEDPVVENLFTASSNATHGADEFLTPSADWQDLSFQFDAGAGYDYLIFGVGGVIQDASTLGVDRFGFDNISFEPAPFAPEDIDQDGDIDGADFLQIQRDNPSIIGDWQAAYPSPLAGINAVPEPNTIVLFGLAVSTFTAVSGRRR